MPLRIPSLVLLATTVAVSVTAREASACGGAFSYTRVVQSNVDVPPVVERPITVDGHTMALKIGKDETVLWDQIAYSGAPEEFAWVVPVRPGGRVEIANAAWFDELDRATNPVITGPTRTCTVETVEAGSAPAGGDDDDGCGCFGSTDGVAALPGSTRAAPDPRVVEAGVETPVQIVSRSTIGPYETVTLRAKEGASITQWLLEHHFAITPDAKPILAAYTSEGFDFIAMRLRPEADVTSMQPVRLITPGADPTVPLRLASISAASTVDLTLYVVAEGRYQARTYPNATFDPARLRWLAPAARSNYKELIDEGFASNGGNAWLTDVASRSLFDVVAGRYPQCARGRNTDEVEVACESSDAGDDAGDAGLDAGRCVKTVDRCDELLDVELARKGLVGSIWITRLRARLPRAALTNDLVLEAGPQIPIEAFHSVDQYSDPNDDPCALATKSVTPLEASKPSPLPSSAVESCRTTRRTRSHTGTWILAGVTALEFARMTRRRR